MIKYSGSNGKKLGRYATCNFKFELVTYGIFLKAVYDSGQERLAFFSQVKKKPAVDAMNFFVYIVVWILI